MASPKFRALFRVSKQYKAGCELLDEERELQMLDYGRIPAILSREANRADPNGTRSGPQASLTMLGIGDEIITRTTGQGGLDASTEDARRRDCRSSHSGVGIAAIHG
jgi:hypothetical protein